ncbi:hypothetical protein SAMN05216229_106127 [Geopseudomonas sagittaria]|uniref:Circularly permuted type 2 ATP-grasp protein n=1 Tax=Geopseudomonas sagittaria TaxID=1135990 RepID=A0A1I5THY0_9GAMM|nr:hypothetical protein [Pseudomonas sagittaria]SFP82659.1 hypothetical protein SAMN05216229_106127 [Pseudomonas sagittaria]
MTKPTPSLLASDASFLSTAEAAASLAGVSIEALNSRCFCISLDHEALRKALASALDAPDLFELVRQRCPHLFATRPVFVAPAHLERMALVVQAIETIVVLPAWREEVLARSPAIARHDPGGAKGVFFGYDFHVEESGLGLIEINSNAGGAMLNAVAARAQRACCPSIETLLPPSARAEQLEARIVAMFRQEWSRAGHDRPLRSIAIVDEAPEQQYLYPEFLLFQQLFQRHGWQAVIADPGELSLKDGQLWHGELAIDLVYNRLTDFAFEDAGNATLRQAYLEHAALITPHPQAHALYADKHNLTLLSDDRQLQALGVPEATRELLLASIPHTERVSPANAERLWRERRRLFFKPCTGFGSRAAYRGDKLTQRVWQEILSGDYVAQALVPPGQRVISRAAEEQTLKFDLRNYAYDGAVQWVAARLYQGQTTNFRTPGGGFAPVYPGPAPMPQAGQAHHANTEAPLSQCGISPEDQER